MEFLFEIILLALERSFWNKIQLGDTTVGYDISFADEGFLNQDVAEENFGVEILCHPSPSLSFLLSAELDFLEQKEKAQKVKQDGHRMVCYSSAVCWPWGSSLTHRRRGSSGMCTWELVSVGSTRSSLPSHRMMDVGKNIFTWNQVGFP